jgi:hypothetical protein
LQQATKPHNAIRHLLRTRNLPFDTPCGLRDHLQSASGILITEKSVILASRLSPLPIRPILKTAIASVFLAIRALAISNHQVRERVALCIRSTAGSLDLAKVLAASRRLAMRASAWFRIGGSVFAIRNAFATSAIRRFHRFWWLLGIFPRIGRRCVGC